MVQGKLWPVNNWALQNVKGLYARNERVITYMQTEIGLVAIIKVGALNVGSISVSYDDLRSNCNLSLIKKRDEVFYHQYQLPITVEKGDEIGVFNLGSSVVVLFEANSFFPNKNCRRGPIKMGTSLSDL